MAHALGRRVPADFTHVERYPLSAAVPTAPVPVVLGINWYTNFDTPVSDGGRYWIGRGALGSVRGGHCVCVKPPRLADPAAWWSFYDQGNEGACVGFGSSRCVSLFHHKRYQAFWLYRAAQQVDDRPGDNYEGTTVRAGFDVLRAQGHVPVARRGHLQMSDSEIAGDAPLAAEGVAANRWAQSMDEVLAALGDPNLPGLPVVNSWGRSYPHVVYLDLTAAERVLFQEDGEVCVPTDR